MVVHPEFRGHNIGSILMRNALDEAEALGYEKVTLLVDEKKSHLHKLYKKLGFEFGDVVLFFGEPYIRMFQYLR